MKKILGVILIILFISGCTKTEDLDKLSESIINFHTNYDYDISSLSEENQKLLNDLKYNEKKENKVINLSENDMMNDYFSTNNPDSEGVYYKDGEYFIKYEDVNFKRTNDGSYAAEINVNGYEIELYKSNYPILYYETNNVNYNYRFMKKEIDDNSAKYYYRSYGNGSMLKIDYKLNNGKVDKINLIYDDYYTLEEESTQNSSNGVIVITVIGVLLLGVFAIYFIKKFKTGGSI